MLHANKVNKLAKPIWFSTAQSVAWPCQIGFRLMLDIRGFGHEALRL